MLVVSNAFAEPATYTIHPDNFAWKEEPGNLFLSVVGDVVGFNRAAANSVDRAESIVFAIEVIAALQGAFAFDDVVQALNVRCGQCNRQTERAQPAIAAVRELLTSAGICVLFCHDLEDRFH